MTKPPSDKSPARRKPKKTTPPRATPSRPTTPPAEPAGQAELDAARRMWLTGDWEGLARLAETDLEAGPARARLALLAAAGLSRVGDQQAAAVQLRRAREWGCDRRLMARIMVSGLHDSLGQSAALLGEEETARRHVDAALMLGMPGADTSFFGAIRLGRPAGRTALPGGAAAGDRQLASPARTARAETPPLFSPEALGALEEAESRQAEGGGRFVYLDAKSIPRSGLHYVRNTLDRVLGDGFSFCEWYQEPGCCRRMPCALTDYATQAAGREGLALRMVKSHDFELADPRFPTGGAIRRLVIARDPLFVLTSWWTLDLLTRHADLLESHAIHPAKIYYKHETAAKEMAYRLIDETFVPPGRAEIEDWLDKRSRYLLRFARKWAAPAKGAADRGRTVLRYETISQGLTRLLSDLEPMMSEAQRTRSGQYREAAGDGFRPRRTPFAAPGERLSAWLAEEADRFRDAAGAVARQDTTELLHTDPDL